MKGKKEKGSTSASSYEALNGEHHHDTLVELNQHEEQEAVGTICCPNCSHKFEPTTEMLVDFFKRFVSKFGGVKFEPSDEQLIDHLEAKVNKFGDIKHNPLTDEFIVTIEGEKGICYTTPDGLPGVTKDGTSKHFFHKSSKAYKTGSRKRRKIQSTGRVHDVSETRWHKTGKTRPIVSNGIKKGCKKILVLYTNFGKSRKPAKTNWIMHQYHLGGVEDENDGGLVVSKIFYQTHPRQSNNEGKKYAGPYEFIESGNINEVPSEQRLQPEVREPMSYMQMLPYLNLQGPPAAPQVLPMPALHLNPPKLLSPVSHLPALNLNAPSGLFTPVVMDPILQVSPILPNNYQQNMPSTSTYQFEQHQQFHGNATTSLEEMMTGCTSAVAKDGISNAHSNGEWGFLNWQTNTTNE